MAIYRPDGVNRFSINGYYSELSNVIDMENNPYTAIGFTNYPKRFSKGVELEYSFTPNTSHKLSINASFNHTTYNSTSYSSASQTTSLQPMPMPDISPIMYKAWYIYSPTRSLTFGIKHLLYSKTTQNADESDQSSVPANMTTDINTNWEFARQTSISLLINNIQNNKVRMPSYYNVNHLPTNDGLLREGRNFFITLRKSF